jgi:L-alanine-DL-glutamate epimerase-like enolase superfamily enzyme
VVGGEGIEDPLPAVNKEMGRSWCAKVPTEIGEHCRTPKPPPAAHQSVDDVGLAREGV